MRYRLAAVAAAAALAAVLGAAGAVTTATPASALTCGYLDDGDGAGSAASLPPGATIQGGDLFYQESAGAWRLCYAGTNKSLELFANPNYCMAANNGIAVLRSCNGNSDQQWTITANDTYKNGNGGGLCAEDGVGSQDLVVSLSACSTYHEQWKFESNP